MSDQGAKRCGSALLAIATLSLLLVFAAIPDRGRIRPLVLRVHETAFSGLFAFLVASELLQARAWLQIRRGKTAASVASSMRKMWTLSEIAPAPIAIAIFLTGLRLIWESPATNSPSQLWLLLLILSFGVFFFDGILGYQPIVRGMYLYWRDAAQRELPVGQAAREWRAASGCVQLLLHCLSWPLVFAVGILRWTTPNPISLVVGRGEHALLFLPPGWPQAATAVMLWAVAGCAVLLARAMGPIVRRSRCARIL